MASPPCEASEAGAGVGGVACDAVINALATIEAWTQDQAHGGCGHRKEPKPHATASRMWVGEPSAMAMSPSLHQRVSLVTMTSVTVHLCIQFLGLGAGAQFVWQVLLPGIISALGSDAGFLWRGASPESPTPIAPSLSSLSFPPPPQTLLGCSATLRFPHMSNKKLALSSHSLCLLRHGLLGRLPGFPWDLSNPQTLFYEVSLGS